MLNPAQKDAVFDRNTGLLVLAGAGTGKTRVITTRISELVKEGVEEKRILAVTFTNKAAKEMRVRLREFEVGEDVWVGTFHSIGLRVLKMHGKLLGYSRNFSIYDDDDQKALIKALLATVDTKGKTLNEGLLHYYIQQCKGRGITSKDTSRLEEVVPKSICEIVREVYGAYDYSLLKSNAMDYGDLLLRSVELLEKAEGTPASWLRERFQHVLVDEFQDTNPLQMRMADLLATKGSLCVVGDDDQSIYAWRGADPTGMQKFANRPNVRVIKLEENYRCTAKILACANAVIAQNKGRLGKVLVAHKEGDAVSVRRFTTDTDEARHVARSVRGPFEKNAVLYRTHAQSRVLEEAFRAQGIPYTIIGGLKFYDRAEVKDMLSFFRLAVNPKSDVDLLRVANKPPRGMGPKRMGILKTAASERGVSVYEILKEDADPTAQALYKLLLKLNEARHDCLSVSEFYDEVLRLTGYRSHLVNVASTSKSEARKEQARIQIENIDEVGTDLVEFARTRRGTVEDYLEHVALVSTFDKEAGAAVSFMTIHASKGLEFDRVFVVGCGEGLLPHENSLKDELKKPHLVEEERRLMYVAITRAREHLELTVPKMRQKQKKWHDVEPSRFLDELDSRAILRFGFIE
jgi:DNA helicase-2/ATP-dependent DNA helicase PcrA